MAEYKHKWSSKEDVDVRAFNEFEHKVNEQIQRKIASLRRKHINRNKKHGLKCMKHVESLKFLHDNYVLVPANKAAHNVVKSIVWRLLQKEIMATTTYEPITRSRAEVISE